MLRCQIDSTLREMEVSVIRCTETEGGSFQVVLNDTPFYPEGGGQPADHGTIGHARVLDVQRENNQVVHRVDAHVEGTLLATVDWARRLDHMQQHTAQHLLTAVILASTGAETVGFHLGEETTTIDLDIELQSHQLEAAFDAANTAIRAARPVQPQVVDREGLERLGVRSRGLPDGVRDNIRVVEIEGIDLNTCGGTHVSSTAELQVVHRVKTERHKGGLRVHFVAGERARATLEAAREREHALSTLLTAGKQDHVGVVSSLLADAKQRAKQQRAVLAELGELLGLQLSRSSERAMHLHRNETDANLLKQIADTALSSRPELCLLLTAGDPDGEGRFLIAGPAHIVDAAGPHVATALSGRGGGRGGRFQGKAADLSTTDAALDIIMSHIADE